MCELCTAASGPLDKCTSRHYHQIIYRGIKRNYIIYHGPQLVIMVILVYRLVVMVTSHYHQTVYRGIYNQPMASGVTERLGALGDIDTREPFTMSPVILMSV